MKKFISICALALPIVFPGLAHANEWINNVDVIQVGAYPDNNNHFVWLAQGAAPECRAANSSNPVYNFADNTPGGKSILAMLLMALTAKRQVNIQAQGCKIVELNLK